MEIKTIGNLIQNKTEEQLRDIDFNDCFISIFNNFFNKYGYANLCQVILDSVWEQIHNKKDIAKYMDSLEYYMDLNTKQIYSLYTLKTGQKIALVTQIDSGNHFFNNLQLFVQFQGLFQSWDYYNHNYKRFENVSKITVEHFEYLIEIFETYYNIRKDSNYFHNTYLVKARNKEILGFEYMQKEFKKLNCILMDNPNNFFKYLKKDFK